MVPATSTTPRSTESAPDYDPDELFEMTYESFDYLCTVLDVSISRYPCVLYSGGPSPDIVSVITAPDLYCSGTATFRDCSGLWFPSDLDEYDLRTVDGHDVICTSAGTFSSPGDQACYLYAGGNPSTATTGLADYMCSSSRVGISDCATDYYPSEMADYKQYKVNGGDVICTDARVSGSFGDLDCYRYSGGNPSDAVSGTPDYKCTPSGLSVDCASDYYPSEMEGLTIVSIRGADYICQDSFEGQECFVWFGQGSPTDAIGFRPDYYCNLSGCSPDDYP